MISKADILSKKSDKSEGWITISKQIRSKIQKEFSKVIEVPILNLIKYKFYSKNLNL